MSAFDAVDGASSAASKCYRGLDDLRGGAEAQGTWCASGARSERTATISFAQKRGVTGQGDEVGGSIIWTSPMSALGLKRTSLPHRKMSANDPKLTLANRRRKAYRLPVSMLV
jgi:hypothetical protein